MSCCGGGCGGCGRGVCCGGPWVLCQAGQPGGGAGGGGQSIASLQIEFDRRYLLLAGGQMVGPIKLASAPVTPDDAATKAYVDGHITQVLTLRDTVPDEASLPPAGNQSGDVRATVDTGQLFLWDGTKWSPIGKASTPIASGTAIGQILAWNGIGWIAADPRKPMPDGTAAGQFLSWDGTGWVVVDTVMPDGQAPGQMLMWDGNAWQLVEDPRLVGAFDLDVPVWDAANSEWIMRRVAPDDLDPVPGQEGQAVVHRSGGWQADFLTMADIVDAQDLGVLFDSTAAPGAWTAAAAYNRGDVVVDGGHVWIAHDDTQAGDRPGVTPHWRSLTLEALYRGMRFKELPDWDWHDAGKVLGLDPVSAALVWTAGDRPAVTVVGVAGATPSQPGGPPATAPGGQPVAVFKVAWDRQQEQVLAAGGSPYYVVRPDPAGYKQVVFVGAGGVSTVVASIPQGFSGTYFAPGKRFVTDLLAANVGDTGSLGLIGLRRNADGSHSLVMGAGSSLLTIVSATPADPPGPAAALPLGGHRDDLFINNADKSGWVFDGTNWVALPGAGGAAGVMQLRAAADHPAHVYAVADLADDALVKPQSLLFVTEEVQAPAAGWVTVDRQPFAGRVPAGTIVEKISSTAWIERYRPAVSSFRQVWVTKPAGAAAQDLTYTDLNTAAWSSMPVGVPLVVRETTPQGKTPVLAAADRAGASDQSVRVGDWIVPVDTGNDGTADTFVIVRHGAGGGPHVKVGLITDHAGPVYVDRGLAAIGVTGVGDDVHTSNAAVSGWWEVEVHGQARSECDLYFILHDGHITSYANDAPIAVRSGKTTLGPWHVKASSPFSIKAAAKVDGFSIWSVEFTSVDTQGFRIFDRQTVLSNDSGRWLPVFGVDASTGSIFAQTVVKQFKDA